MIAKDPHPAPLDACHPGNGEAVIRDGLDGWEFARALLRRRPDLLHDDIALLTELGLRSTKVVEILPAALARMEAERARETTARQAVETVAEANFIAQAQTNAAVLDLLEARNNADLARRVDEAARARFGLLGAALAAESPDPVPLGWRDLPPGGVDDLLGPGRIALLGPLSSPVRSTGEGDREAVEGAGPALLFGADAASVGSAALIRLALWRDDRPGLLAFASRAPDGFTPAMGAELLAYLARVVERTADRWPVL